MSAGCRASGSSLLVRAFGREELGVGRRKQETPGLSGGLGLWCEEPPASGAPFEILLRCGERAPD